MSLKIQVQVDLKDATSIELDTINDDNTAQIYVAYNSGVKEFKVSLKELQRMASMASFKWHGTDNE